MIEFFRQQFVQNITDNLDRSIQFFSSFAREIQYETYGWSFYWHFFFLFFALVFLCRIKLICALNIKWRIIIYWSIKLISNGWITVMSGGGECFMNSRIQYSKRYPINFLPTLCFGSCFSFYELRIYHK